MIKMKEEIAMRSIFDIANWFLSRELMTHKKLQKLCFYAQAWHLALYQERMFDAEFQAWVHGPVNYPLYQEYRRYGWTSIPRYNGDLNLDQREIDFLERIWATYGEYDGHQLEAFTHSEDPWLNARAGLNQWQNSNNIISEADMQNYYSNRYSGD